MNKTQKGFALVEGLLILLILAVIGFGGYYVWHSQRQTDKSLTQANQVSQSTKTSSKASRTYFTIKEWGVRGSYDGSVNLKYKVFSNNPNGISFSSSEIEAANSTCKVELSSDAGYGGVVRRYLSSDKFLNPAGVDTGLTAEQEAAKMDKSGFGHVGNYYFFYEHPQGVCGQSQASIDTEGQAQTAVKSIVANLVAISQ
jgi:hypothetical protein